MKNRFCSALASLIFLSAFIVAAGQSARSAELKTWDGRHDISHIEVTIAYFVPRDRRPLPDWQDRVNYFAKRIEQFHAREFQGQSTLKAKVLGEPFESARTTEQLRAGDGDFIFFQTLREVDRELQFGRDEERKAFPILLVLSEINWRPLDDFFRLSPKDGKLQFEGQFIGGRHFPGATSGGARATYLADRGVGWGLVSADGWRVPYSGTDCVVYHEGVGHPIGLPHPKPGNSSVMSLGQYRGWISESTLDDDQKERLGWESPTRTFDRSTDLFSSFTAIPVPLVPKPGEHVSLKLTWPRDAQVATVRTRIQTELLGPWIESSDASVSAEGSAAPVEVSLGRFDRPTPVSYRLDVALKSGERVELWGYFQVRESRDAHVVPRVAPASPAVKSQETLSPGESIDLLPMIDVQQDAVAGEWRRDGDVLESPKQLGARIEIPYAPPEEYEMTVVATPLDQPNGLVLGQLMGGHRFLTLVSYAAPKGKPASALENVDGRNVYNNTTTILAELLQKDRPSQVIVTVRKNSVTVQCDGRKIIDWAGKPEQLSLGEYWNTPHPIALFLGAYDCRYRFSRVSIAPISGEGKRLRE